MSTKATILYGDTYHLYEECMTDDIYLDIHGEKLDFKVTPYGVTVRLPAEFLKAFKEHMTKKAKKKK